MNYYDEILIEIENKIKNNELDKAKSIIENELSMLYIPIEFENKLKLLLQDLKIEENRYLNEENIIQYLKEGKNEFLIYNFLINSNIKKYIIEAKSFLSISKDKQLKQLFIKFLIDEGIDEEFISNNIKFNPSKLISHQKREEYNYLCDYFYNLFSNDNPTFLKISLEMIELLFLNKLPTSVKKVELEQIKNSIEYYIYNNFGMFDEMGIIEKKLDIIEYNAIIKGIFNNN